jgi:NAD(P)-dependent dehydrogenase (short-subunit alcohol dehydrogenase family)
MPGVLDLSGRVAVVTGAAQGIGEAVALALAAHGADLGLCDRNADGLEQVATAARGFGRTVSTGVFDVREPEAVTGFVDAVAGTFGRIDVLVNNAGGGFAAPFLEVRERGQDALVRENFTSVTSFVRAVVPHVPPPEGERGGGGSIVNITSIEAHRAGPGFAVYSAMKAAVANLTASLALELAPRHIRVNAVAPDVIPTPGIGPVGVTTPLPYPGRADDVAAAVLFLAGEGARFVTGTTVHVDGGNLAAGGWRRQPDGTYRT